MNQKWALSLRAKCFLAFLAETCYIYILSYKNNNEVHQNLNVFLDILILYSISLKIECRICILYHDFLVHKPCWTFAVLH